MFKKNLYLAVVALSTGLLLEGIIYPSLAVQKTTTQPSTYPENYIAQARTYKIKLGDTLSGIAYKNGVTVQQILAFNANLRKNPNLIQVGQVIYLSKPAQSATKPRSSTVARRQSVQTFNLPNQRRMGNNRVGARRGNPEKECRSNVDDSLRVLLPDTNFGYTLKDYPTFFWYMPELKTKADHFELRIFPAGADRSETTYVFKSNNQKSGVMSVSLPPDKKALEEGQEYKWEVRMYCSETMFITASGSIQRLSTNNPQLEAKLEKAAVDDYPAILAQEGIWYDSLAALAGLREEKPNDPSLNNDWTKILKMIGFENIANAPLLVSNDTSNN